MADFVLRLIRDPETLRGEAEKQAEGERRLGRAWLEAERLRGALRGIDAKRERLIDLALDGPFGRDEIARRAALLDAERTALQGKLDALGGDALEGRLRELEALPPWSRRACATCPTWWAAAGPCAATKRCRARTLWSPTA